MSLTLSWDLLIVVVFAMVLVYSFLLGRSQTLKVIVATYVSVLLTEGVGNIGFRLLGPHQPTLAILGIPQSVIVPMLLKLGLFILSVILLTLWGAFAVQSEEGRGSTLSFVETALLGFASAAMISSALLAFVSGAPLLSEAIVTSERLAPLLQTSTLVRVIVVNQDLWFALPAALLILFRAPRRAR